jgi:hypothetical protein
MDDVSKWSVENEEQLIELWQERPCLYDVGGCKQWRWHRHADNDEKTVFRFFAIRSLPSVNSASFRFIQFYSVSVRFTVYSHRYDIGSKDYANRVAKRKAIDEIADMLSTSGKVIAFYFMWAPIITHFKSKAHMTQ